ncbi:MAG: protein kinase domain-containing protein [Pseudomonadota bacterium]
MPGMLGRYILHGELGRGAMSIIFKGRDPHIQRTLAIKTLRPEFARQEDYRYRFLAEARAAGTLTHPSIITIFDVGETDRIPFIAMELLEGPTLETFVKRQGRLTLRTTLKIVIQIADALDYAHRQGVVHQDIKPENIAVTDENAHVKVMDFGIAHLMDGPTVHGGDTRIAGTPEYMSPEQIRGATIDGRSDLYSLGVLLYWLLAGHTPFRAGVGDDVHALLKKILLEPAPAVKPLDPDTPDALLDVVRSLLEKDPARRYQSGGELIEDLRRIDDALREHENILSGRRIIPIRLRWTAVMGTLVAVTVALGLAVVYHRQNTAMIHLAFDYGLTMTQMLAVKSAEDLLLRDRIAIQSMVDDMARNREIIHLTVVDREGLTMASTEAGLLGTHSAGLPEELRLEQRGAQGIYALKDAQGRAFFLFDTPIQYQEQSLGHLRVGLSTEALSAANRTTLMAMITLMLVTLLAVFLGAYILSRRLVIPIELVRHALGQITQGRFDNRIRLHRDDEFERLFAAYNTMADSLEARMLMAHVSERNDHHTQSSTPPSHEDQAGAATLLMERPEVGETPSSPIGSGVEDRQDAAANTNR